MIVGPGESFTAEVTNFPAGLPSGGNTVGVRLIHVASGLEVTPRTTMNTEVPADSGSYIAALTGPTIQGVFTIFWDWGDGVTLIPSHTASEELVVAIPAPTGTSPVQPAAPTGGVAVSVLHFSMPFRFLAGAAVVIEQDTIAEIADCVANVCRYEIGGRPEKPAFGIPPQVFRENGPDVGLLAAAVSAAEPRASIAAQADGSSLEDLVAGVVVTVTDKGAST